MARARRLRRQGRHVFYARVDTFFRFTTACCARNTAFGRGQTQQSARERSVPQLPTDLQLTNQLKGFMKRPKDMTRLNTISQIRTCTTVTTTHCTCISTPSTSANIHPAGLPGRHSWMSRAGQSPGLSRNSGYS